MFIHPRSTSLRHTAMAVALGAVVAITTGDAAAQQPSFDLSISASEAVLANPDSYAVQSYEMWDSPLGRIIKNSRPFIEIENTSDAGSGMLLTEFRITVGDLGFEFSDEILGAFAVEGTTTPGVIESASVGEVTVTAAPTSTIGDELIVAFANGGLEPGEVARFQIDLDTDDEMDHPDHRTVMFDIFDNDNSDNSRFRITFDDTQQDQDIFRVGQLVDLDQPASALGTTIFTNGTIRPYSAMEGVGINGFEVVPEPTTALLALIGMAGLGRLRRC